MIIDLYAGAGGVSEGLRSLGRDDVLGVDVDALAVAIARAAGHKRLQADVYGLDPVKLRREHGRPEGLHGSPPCGGLSSSGLGIGREDLGRVVDLIDCLAEDEDHRADYLLDWQDLRSPLMAEPMRYLRALDPDWFTLEQVPEAVSVWEDYAAHLSSWGWSVDVGVVNARWFGVPQDRERAILAAHKWRPVNLPTGPVVDEVPASTVLGPGVVGFARRADRPSNKAGRNVLVRDGVEYRARDMRSTDRPSFTVTEKVRSWTLDDGVHAPRQLTLDEVGRLQGFPAGYPWPTGAGDRSAAALRIANAVPPPMYAGIVAPLLAEAVTS